MSTQKVNVQFDYDFAGTLTSDKGTIKLGAQEGGMSPYNLLLGGLASCLYATFLEIAMKKKITFDKADISVVGEKREEVPTTLKETRVVMTVHGAPEEARKGLTKAMDLAAKYCSIYQTISGVSEMYHEIRFE